jgi:predicted transcriptional regulator
MTSYTKTRERWPVVLRRHAEGASARAIAAEVGLCVATVGRHLRAGGLEPIREPREPFRSIERAARIAEAARLYAAGCSRDEIAEALGVTPRAVNRYLTAAGVSRRPGPRTHPQPEPRPCECGCGELFTPAAAKIAHGHGGRFKNYRHWNEWRRGRPQSEWRPQKTPIDDDRREG